MTPAVASATLASAEFDAPPSDAAPSVDDVLVFDHADGRFSLLGGAGRGASWAGLVDVSASEGSLVSDAWRRGTLVRSNAAGAVRIVGPYYARHAVAVPVGQSHVVVLGSARPIGLRDAEIVRLAATTVDRTRGVPADKLLADELELVHVLRALMAYRPENVRDTIRHVATVAANALSCELAVIHVEHGSEAITETVSIEGGPAEPILADALAMLGTVDVRVDVGRDTDGPVVEQVVEPTSSLFGIEVASQMTIPLGTDRPFGALALGHRVTHPRGFTSLCRRIGRAVGDAAELLITQAVARENLTAERDLFERISGTDALTGIANRRAWESAAAAFGGADAHVISCDVDGLKLANDRFGHQAGDALIRATANLLGACVRETDLVARLGGDEFAVLLYDASPMEATRIRRRIRRAERRWRVTEHGLSPRLSLGMATVLDGDVTDALCRADAAMYAMKRRRARARALDDRGDRRRRRAGSVPPAD